jgi:phosphoglycolate phosphatase-like HAD superfamily hydrolase
MTRTLVLFDIDGTLLLTAGAGRRAITSALADRIGTSDAWQRITFDGKTDPQIVRELLEAAGDASAGDPDTMASRVLLLEQELELAGNLPAEVVHCSTNFGESGSSGS